MGKRKGGMNREENKRKWGKKEDGKELGEEEREPRREQNK